MKDSEKGPEVEAAQMSKEHKNCQCDWRCQQEPGVQIRLEKEQASAKV